MLGEKTSCAAEEETDSRDPSHKYDRQGRWNCSDGPENKKRHPHLHHSAMRLGHT